MMSSCSTVPLFCGITQQAIPHTSQNLYDLYTNFCGTINGHEASAEFLESLKFFLHSVFQTPAVRSSILHKINESLKVKSQALYFFIRHWLGILKKIIQMSIKNL